ncbi:MAG TPA: cobyrinate a,c-diamide synthase [Xenococcaceae cyanobacterium]
MELTTVLNQTDTKSNQGLIIAGERSGVGKTTITLALLAFLVRQGYKVQAFKVGPDYIDPMFHTAITGIPSRNLDPILTSVKYVQACFTRHTQGIDYVVVEGVMGLFDGVEWQSLNDYASTAHIARILQLPVAIVIDCSRLSGSVAAVAYGYSRLDPQIQVAGVILNKVGSDRHLQLLQSALASLKMPILGVFSRDRDIIIPDRHLGLVPTAELPQISSIAEKLATLAKTCCHWDLLLPLLQSSSQPHHNSSLLTEKTQFKQPESLVKIAVARDRAFNFYYQDNLEILQDLGAELIFWSPLEALELPQDVAGIYFGGGFPEVFAEALNANYLVRQQVHQAILSGMPVYAECGGLMYLCDRIIDFNHQSWAMVGAIPATAKMSQRLTLGYRQVTPLHQNCLVPPQSHGSLWGHEFHRSQLDALPQYPLWQIQGCDRHAPKSSEGWQIQQVHASYLHLHFGAAKFFAQRWLKSCRNYQNRL